MLSDKKLAQLEKILDADTRQELSTASVDEMRKRIAEAAGAIKTATDELEANPQYQELRESLRACSEGVRELKKRQNAIVQYSLHILEDRGTQ